MIRFRFAMATAGLLALLSLSGCFWSIGGGSQKTVVEHSAGQQLTDLKRALEAGALSPEEYDKLKKVYLSK
jgi:hypothetical protein